MEQAMIKSGRHSGWSEMESKLLWETADEAQQQGTSLKAVFERIAEQTGRRPNSIRNYYYAQVRQREGDRERVARFVPFTQEEVDWLMEQVLVARAAGQSVRACLQRLAGGDHSLMLRYQNKYRAMIKSRPDYVRSMVERLNGQGVACDQPQVRHRSHADAQEICGDMVRQARQSCDGELARALQIISDRLSARREGPDAELSAAAQDLIDPIKEFVARPVQERAADLDAFCDALLDRVGALEACLPAVVE
jgi:hypothetical protein